MRRNWRRVAARTKDLQRNSRVTVDIGKLRLRQNPLSSRFARRLSAQFRRDFHGHDEFRSLAALGMTTCRICRRPAWPNVWRDLYIPRGLQGDLAH